MIRKILFASAATAAMALAATPASAQEVCETNGTSSTSGTASSSHALACGDYSTATGHGSTVYGYGANGNGAYTVAVGHWSDAIGGNATAVGGVAQATAAGSTAIGGYTVASGIDSTAIGEGSDATAVESVAVGSDAQATALGAVAIGDGALANGAGSVAIGDGASNGGFANSVALGTFTNTAANQVRVGGSTAATARVVTGVAAGTTTYDAVNFGQLTSTNNRVTALEAMGTGFAADIANLNTRVDNVYKRGKAGTAVAIAMSGNGFLPDKKINVTGNLGFYSGAYAAALQVGAILTDSVAFNAGVAKGLNDGGKMGARMGFTLGW